MFTQSLFSHLVSYLSYSPRVFDEKPIKAGIGAGGPSTFEELLERELRSQPRSMQSKSGGTSASGKNIPPRATTPTGSKKFDKLKLVNRSVSAGNVLAAGPPGASTGPQQFAAGRSVSSAQFPAAHLGHSTTSPNQDEDDREFRRVGGGRGPNKRTHSRNSSKDGVSPRGLLSPRALISPREVEAYNIEKRVGGDANGFEETNSGKDDSEDKEDAAGVGSGKDGDKVCSAPICR